MKGIKEPSSNKAYNQDKWRFFAKMTTTTVGVC
jgi:hypothetical protein